MLNETLESDRAYRKDIHDAYQRGYEKGKKDTQMCWIPCSKWLPRTDNWRTEYIVTYDRGYKEDTKLETTCMSWENTIVRGKPVSRWIWHGVISPWKVVAWMEKPKPYKGENNESD